MVSRAGVLDSQLSATSKTLIQINERQNRIHDSGLDPLSEALAIKKQK
jgi:hypothetical protein